MPARRELKHIIVPVAATAETYTPHPRKIKIPKPPAPPSRNAHGMMLKRELSKVAAEADRRRLAAGISIKHVTPGLYVQFESRPDIPLTLTALENKPQGIELVAVTHDRTDEQVPRRIERATVFVPAGKVKHFITRFESYAKMSTPTRIRVNPTASSVGRSAGEISVRDLALISIA